MSLKPRPALTGQITPYIGAALLLIGIALSSRSILLLAILLGMLWLIDRSGKLSSMKQVLASLWSPFLPFAVGVLAIAPFQSKPTDVLWMLTIPASYVFARFLRTSARPDHLAVGISLVGLTLGGLNLLAQTQVVAWIPTIEKLAAYHHKNGFGWMLAFAIAAAPVMFSFFRFSRLASGLIAGLVLSLGIMLILTDSVTSIVAAVAALGLVVVFAVIGRKRRSFRPSNFAVTIALVSSTVLAGAFALANFLPAAAPGLEPLGRSPNLTGRVEIWGCYFEALSSGAAEVAIEVRDCVGYGTNLHSSFLTAHSYGGLILSLLLLSGFLAAIVLSAIGLARAKRLSAHQNFLFALLISVVGFLIATVESYVFSGFIYVSILVFMAPVAKQDVDFRIGDWFRRRGVAGD